MKVIVSNTRIIPIIMGIRIAKIDKNVDMTSSAMLTGVFAAPAVVAVSAGRTAADLTVCTLPAINNPAIIDRIGLISVRTFALAAKAIAPAMGRTKVWMMSLI